MRYYAYDEPGADGENVHVVMSEADVLAEYYEYWSSRMRERFGPDVLLDDGACLRDWVAVNWAYEVE